MQDRLENSVYILAVFMLFFNLPFQKDDGLEKMASLKA